MEDNCLPFHPVNTTKGRYKKGTVSLGLFSFQNTHERLLHIPPCKNRGTPSPAPATTMKDMSGLLSCENNMAITYSCSKSMKKPLCNWIKDLMSTA